MSSQGYKRVSIRRREEKVESVCVCVLLFSLYGLAEGRE